MHNTSLLEILRTFSHDELKTFEDFLCSPYFNKHLGVINFYKQIKKYAPEFKSARLKRERIWKALYPDKEYNYGILKNLIFDLTHLAEKFIVFQYYQNYEFQMYYDLLDSINERQITNLFKSKFRKIEQEMENSYKSKKVVASSYHYYLSKMYLLKWAFCQQFDRRYGSNEDFEKHSVLQAAVILYSIFHTSINAVNFSRDHIYNKDENTIAYFVEKADSYNLITEFIESIKKSSIEIHKILNAYHKYYISVWDNTSLEKYLDFKNDLILSAPGFSKPDRFILYSGLRNALSKLTSIKINKSKEICEIIKLKIKDDVMLTPDGIVADTEFAACIHAACDIEESEFIVIFTESFMKYLPKDSRANLKKYSLAHIYFTGNEFAKSLETIMTIKLDFFILKYYLKNLQMMNYYELNNYNSFVLLLDSYKHFLNKNKSVTENWKKDQQNFNLFLSKMFRLKENYNGFETKKLKEEISSSLVSNKQWLLRKAGELRESK